MSWTEKHPDICSVTGMAATYTIRVNWGDPVWKNERWAVRRYAYVDFSCCGCTLGQWEWRDLDDMLMCQAEG